jgi:hypothetical protein
MVVMHDRDGALDFNDCVYLFRSPKDDWRLALKAAVAAGQANEVSYDNPDGERIRWRVKEVLTLDCLGPELADPVEVHSTFRDPDRPIASGTRFEPESSQPEQTGVPFRGDEPVARAK